MEKQKENVVEFKTSDYKKLVTIPKEFGAWLYDSRYRYGYNWSGYQPLAKKVIDTMKMTGCKDKKILDVGAGMGWFTDCLYFNLSKKVKGIDFSEIGIWYFAKKLYPAIEFEVANIYDYDYTGHEIFTMMEVLEHIEKDIDLIQKFPKGGQIYATVPFEKLVIDPSHLRFYTLKEVEKRYGELIDLKMVEQVGRYILFWGTRK